MHTNTRFSWLLVVAGVLALFGGCRGGIKKSPPIHVVLDMDFQEKIKAQLAFGFEGWKDGRGMRLPVANTVARGALDDIELAVFKDPDGAFIDNPVAASLEVVRRGQQRFDIFCAVCHSRSGDLRGVVLQRAGEGTFNVLVPKLSQDERIVAMKDGELFSIATEGKNTMAGYADQISVRDRWAIVHYLRVLQSRFQ